MNDGNRRRNVMRGLAAVVLALGLSGVVVGLGHAFAADDTTWSAKLQRVQVTTPSSGSGTVHALDTTWS